ncbi:PepSY domain-containing protein [Streptoalloteichus hindustanus]|uniref:Peptidase propeptide and YPEB domain-containing protein n=1 Tax=Streptoalloteichus hindustanus TaxID=2017 RepID=A0A1M5EK11_STRHI|nr:PepSY domain-containing protein [Streptoalloteichus hindustanus]SHF79598.1 Peptidase propeptide and YPEB domain-containing protein [Streptoalloteichus hindustanus]
MRNHARALIPAAVVLLAALITGCGEGPTPEQAQIPTAPPKPHRNTTGKDTRPGASPSPNVSDGVRDAVNALRTATGTVPDSRAFDLEHETRGGDRLWEVKVVAHDRETKLDVSEDGSRVLARSDHGRPDDDIRKLDAAKIDAARAAEIAGQRENGRLTELEIDTLHDGTVVWEIHFARPDGARTELKIDARTGEIARER